MNLMKFSKNQNDNNYHGKIDLHGYTKSEAISKLTSYMEQQVTTMHNNNNKRRQNNSNKEIWILVITGSGAHSNQGPVLRDAIQSLFDKRQMIYQLNHGRGSFTVNANSGIKLYGPDMPSDTKVVVIQPQDDGLTIPQRGKSRSNNATSGWNRSKPPPTASDYDPSISEIAANEAQFHESKKMHENEMKLNAKEGRLLKKALSLSMLEVESDNIKQQQQQQNEEDMLKRAMSLSMLDVDNQQQYNYDDDLLKAMELSKKESATAAAAAISDDNEDYDLEKILAISIQEQKQKQDNNKTTSTTEDEILEFQRILEQSKTEF